MIFTDMGSWRIIMTLIFTGIACIIFCLGNKLLGLWCLECSILIYLTEIWEKIDKLKR